MQSCSGALSSNLQGILCKASSVLQQRDREEGNSRFPGPASGNMQSGHTPQHSRLCAHMRWLRTPCTSLSALLPTLPSTRHSQRQAGPCVQLGRCRAADWRQLPHPPHWGPARPAKANIGVSTLPGQTVPWQAGCGATSGTSHTLRCPQFSTEAASRFCILRDTILAVARLSCGPRPAKGRRWPLRRQCGLPEIGFYRGSTWTAEEVVPSATHGTMSTTLELHGTTLLDIVHA